MMLTRSVGLVHFLLDRTKMMIYKYGLVLTGGQIASAEQVDCLISTAVLSSEKFYPAFQLAVYGDKTPKEAIQVAIAEAFGRA